MKTGVLGTSTPTNKERLLAAYAAYNRQDGAALLALVSEDVDWPDDSARLHGKAELRAYWTRQWAMTRTHDEPVEITDLSPTGALSASAKCSARSTAPRFQKARLTICTASKVG